MFIKYLSSPYYRSDNMQGIVEKKSDKKWTSVPAFITESSEWKQTLIK